MSLGEVTRLQCENLGGAPTRMKIRPGMNFFNENPQYFGSPPVIHFLLGTRFDESTARKATMDAHTRMDSDLHAHGTIPLCKHSQAD